MDDRRAIGGFVGTLGGFVLSLIQTIHPEWLGNHPWILPVALVLLFCSGMLWLCQYRWAQALLGITERTSAQTPEWKDKTYWRDKFLWADGERIKLETELKTKGQTHDEEVRKLEVSHAAELSRSFAVCDQIKAEKREALAQASELKSQLSLFTPLQIEAFRLSNRLRRFLGEMGPRPDADWQTGDKSDPDWMAIKFAEQRNVQSPWFLRLSHRYAREFANDVIEVMHHFGEAGTDAAELVPFANGVLTEGDVLKVAHIVDGMAIAINQSTMAIRDTDADTIGKYESLNSDQMRRLIERFPEAKEAVDVAYLRKKR
jgi:hypothetical protein